MDEIDEGGGVIEEAKYQKYPTECIIIQCKKYWQVLMFNTFNIAFRFSKIKPRSISFRVWNMLEAILKHNQSFSLRSN